VNERLPDTSALSNFGWLPSTQPVSKTMLCKRCRFAPRSLAYDFFRFVRRPLDNLTDRWENYITGGRATPSDRASTLWQHLFTFLLHRYQFGDIFRLGLPPSSATLNSRDELTEADKNV
jgi:hypothetical protein